MLSQDIESCAVSLGVMAGQVSEEHWAFLRILQENLREHAAQARHLEQELLPPAGAGALPRFHCATPDSIGYEGNRDITGLMGIFR